MNRSKPTLLLHPLFLGSLLLLLLNDHWWKQAYPGFVTGKLSDFSGVFVFGVLLRELFPQKRIAISVIVVAGFVYWKSPVSQTFIDWSNRALSLPIDRVVDYSDLAALVMLVPAFRIEACGFRSRGSLLWLKLPVMGFSLFAITATSIRTMYRSPIATRVYDQDFRIERTPAEILHRLDSLAISYHIDSIYYVPLFQNNQFLQSKDTPDQRLAIDSMKNVILVERFKESPYYVIPFIVLEGDTIRNLHIRIKPLNRKTEVDFISLELPAYLQQSFYKAQPAIRRYRRAFKSMLTAER